MNSENYSPSEPQADPHSPYQNSVSSPLKMNGGMRFLTLAYASGLGTGYSPFASGTVGTVLGLGLFALLAPLHGGWLPYLLATFIIIWSGILAGSVAEAHYGRKDDGRVTIDEVAGTLITMLFAPVSWKAIILGFFLFRFFDIVKVFPAGPLQKVRGGLGIMVDDLVAGVYSCICLHIILAIWS